MNSHTPSGRSLWWSGLLAFLPVIGLAWVGLDSLRRDQSEVQATAQRELSRLSSRFAEDLSRQLGASLGGTNGSSLEPQLVTGQLDELGQLRSIVIGSSVPSAPPWWLELGNTGRERYRQFTASTNDPDDSLPPEAQLALQFEQARRAGREVATNALRLEAWLTLAGSLPSGLSLAEAAAWSLLSPATAAPPSLDVVALGRYLNLESPGSWPELKSALAHWAAQNPSLAPGVDALRELGERRYQEGQVLSEYGRRYPFEDGRPVTGWLQLGSNWWQVLSSPDLTPRSFTNSTGTGAASRIGSVVLLRESHLTKMIERVVGEFAFQLPEYAQTRVLLSGRELTGTPNRRHSVVSGDSDFSPLRSIEVEIQGAVLSAQAGVVVGDPAVLFSGYRRRTRRVAGLIFGAVLTSALGFWQMRRAYLSQQRLAEQQANFVSSVSHELRAPVASVGLLVEALSDGSLTEPNRRADYFRLLKRECRRLGQLIQNVLAVGRLDQGRREYVFEPLDLKRLVIETVACFQPLAGEQNVHLTVNLAVDGKEIPEPEGGPAFELNGDSLALQQALSNLLDNALKHSPPGGTIGVTLAVCNSRIHLSVRDAGPGVPKDERERVFERFYRRGSELRRETQGLGLGLTLVRHTVIAHGGQVWCENGPGGSGARFVLELPVDSTEAKI